MICAAAEIAKFKGDFDRTVKDLYRSAFLAGVNRFILR